MKLFDMVTELKKRFLTRHFRRNVVADFDLCNFQDLLHAQDVKHQKKLRKFHFEFSFNSSIHS